MKLLRFIIIQFIYITFHYYLIKFLVFYLAMFVDQDDF